MAPEDWRLLARVLRAGEKRTWGVHEAATHHLGTVLRAMAEEAEALAAEAEAQGELSSRRRHPVVLGGSLAGLVAH